VAEPVVLFDADDLPAPLAEEVPAPLRAAGTVFFFAAEGSPAVAAAMAAVPEPPCAPQVVEAAFALAGRLSRGLSGNPAFVRDLKGSTPAGQSVVVNLGFHPGEPAAVRAAFAGADVRPLQPYLDGVRLARVRVAGADARAVIATPRPRPGRPLGGGWFALPVDAARLWIEGGSVALGDAPVIALDREAPPAIEEPLTEDAARARLHQRLQWEPVRWGDEEGFVFARPGEIVLGRALRGDVIVQQTRPLPDLLPAGGISLARFDAWLLGNRQAWVARGQQVAGALLLDPMLLRAPQLQTQADFAAVALDAAAMAAVLGPLEVPARIDADGLTSDQLAAAWRWLPEVVARTWLPPSRAHLHGLPEPTQAALAQLFLRGTPGFDDEVEPRTFGRAVAELRKAFGKDRVAAWMEAVRGS
jgi:hypothetical protein